MLYWDIYHDISRWISRKCFCIFLSYGNFILSYGKSYSLYSEIVVDTTYYYFFDFLRCICVGECELAVFSVNEHLVI